MFIIIWEYRVKPEKQAEFEKFYSSGGAWADLFKRGEGYLGTELLRSDEAATTYITIDKWVSKQAHEEFLQTWKTEYNQLDEHCTGLTQHEQRIGNFRQLLS